MAEDRDPYFEFYVDAWLLSASIDEMTPAQEGGFLRLLCWAWRDKDCGLKDDPALLARRSRLGADWETLGPAVRAMFVPHPTEPGKIINETQYERWLKRKAYKEAKAAAGRASGVERRNPKPETNTSRTEIEQTANKTRTRGRAKSESESRSESSSSSTHASAHDGGAPPRDDDDEVACASPSGPEHSGNQEAVEAKLLEELPRLWPKPLTQGDVAEFVTMVRDATKDSIAIVRRPPSIVADEILIAMKRAIKKAATVSRVTFFRLEIAGVIGKLDADQRRRLGLKRSAGKPRSLPPGLAPLDPKDESDVAYLRHQREQCGGACAFCRADRPDPAPAHQEAATA